MKRLLIVLILVLSITAMANTSQGLFKTWEYKFEYGPSEKKTNEMGAQGWELIAIQSTGPGTGNNVPTYVFKRPRP